MFRNNIDKLSNMSWIWKSTKQFHARVILICILTAFRSILTLANMVLLKYLIDDACSGDRAGLIRSAVSMIVITVVSVAVQLFTRYLREKTDYNILQLLQRQMYQKLLNKEFVKVTDKHSAEWMNRLVQDIDGVGKSVTTMLPAVIGAIVQLAGSVVLLFEMAPAFLILAVAGGIILLLLNFLMKNPLKQKQRELRDAIGVKNIYLQEHLSKLQIVKAFNREEIVSERANDKIGVVTEKKVNKLKLMVLKSGIQLVASNAAYLIVLLYCAIQILLGNISYGTAILILRIMSQISSPFMEVSSYANGFFDIMVSIERIREVDTYPDDDASLVKDDQEIRSFYDQHFKEIVFSDATFSYSEEEDPETETIPTVFENVDLTIPKHICMAFTGATGSGKSTFFKILMSFYSLQKGTKTIRSADGTEEELDASYRRLFAYVPQGNQLMVGTIREMVTFGNKEDMQKDDKIWEALDTACAKDFVELLPDGLDTVIKEKGMGLSEGQLQRIAVARALFTERPILLLDEATSALDETTERKLLEHLKNMTDRTILFVTHRPNGLEICDREVHINGTEVVIRELNHRSGE